MITAGDDESPQEEEDDLSGDHAVPYGRVERQ
jgi:hypothetical protein